MNAVSVRTPPCVTLPLAVERSGPETVVTVRGELDLSVAPELERVLTDRSPDGGLVVDLRGLSFIDASGLGVLLRAATRARSDGTPLQLIPGARVWRLLELCALERRFTYAPRPPD